MTQSKEVDVAIIGAGPVGMTLACELIRHGLSVRIVDKAPSTKDYGRAPVFWPRAQDALDLMGLHHLWNGKTTPLRRVHVNVYGQPAGTIETDLGESAHPTPMMVGQDVTEKILDEYLRGIDAPVERSVEVTRTELFDHGARITLKLASGGEDSFEAAWVVGCDGSTSGVRNDIGIGWEGHQLRGMKTSVADTHAKWPLSQAGGVGHVALTNKGYTIAVPLPGMMRLLVAIPDDTPKGRQPKVTLEELAALASEAIGGPVELFDPAWVTVVRFGNHLAATFRNGRALLAGDAAHSIAPLSGQGMNTGVQDSFDLGWKLAYVHKGWAPESLLDSYTAERRPVAKKLTDSTDRFFDMLHDPSTSHKALFRVAVPAALKFHKVRETAAEFFTEVGVSYSDSPLNDDQHRREPRPGEYIRDGGLVRWPNLEPMRLYDALRGLHWTVLAFSGADPSTESLSSTHQWLSALIGRCGSDRLRALFVVGEPTEPDLPSESGGVTTTIDAWRVVHDKYDAFGGALLLVRPDGYITLHRGVSDRDRAALETLVGRMLRSAS
jgi:2-polyprenyl-6-methoxyphenol hydroxylase-like FAD-dependent oxidoreductase